MTCSTAASAWGRSRVCARSTSRASVRCGAALSTRAASVDQAKGALDGRSLLDAVKNGYNGITAHSIVFDAASDTLEVYVAPAFDTAAVEAEPTAFALDEIFGRLGELSGR